MDGRVFPTAEHYLMWRKAVLFGDHPSAKAILTAIRTCASFCSPPGTNRRAGQG
ncbi:hypothetical protein [Amycolatopsis albispora]|uniref:hypothetical protein n=1 Tax=Amycolatopsis albispora TaxID=1804986 RepID=UPI003002609F